MNITLIQSSGPTWSDLNSGVGVNGKPAILLDYDSLNNAISNILSCPVGSRGWHPTFGSDLPMLIWEPVDLITANAIKVAVIDAIRQWEKRITLVAGMSAITPNPDGISYNVSLVYKINLTGVIAPPFNFRLSR